MNLYVKYENQEVILANICGLELILSLLWAVVGYVFRKEIGQLLGLSTVLVGCLFITFIFQSVFQCWSLYKRYVYDYKTLISVTLLSTVGSAVLGVIAVCFVDATAEARAVSNTIIVAFIGLILYISVFRKGKAFYDRKVWGFALGFCIPLMPHYLSEFVLQSSDKIMIKLSLWFK